MGASVSAIREVLCALPTAPCVMGSAFEGRRFGVFVTRVVTVADDPPCVAVSLHKGQRLATYIRDSRSFALSILAPSQRLLIKKFRESHLSDADPFDTVETRTLSTGAPVLLRAVAGIDCEVMRHFDLEADHEMYVGQVVDVAVLNAPAPRAESPVTILPGSTEIARVATPGDAVVNGVHPSGNGAHAAGHASGLNGARANGNGKVAPKRSQRQSPALDPRNQLQ